MFLSAGDEAVRAEMKAVWLIMLLFTMRVAPNTAEPKVQQSPGAEEQSSQGTGKVLDLAPGKVLDLVFRVEDMGKS